jgi:hypothetical protein
MKAGIRFIVLFILCYSTTAFGQAKLEGEVVKASGGIAANARIVSPGGQGATADTKSGHFTITFGSLKPGLSIRIMVVSPSGWKVCEPVFGIDYAQDLDNRERRQVVIAQLKSPLLKGPKYISKLLGYMTREIAEQKMKLEQSRASVTLQAKAGLAVAGSKQTAEAIDESKQTSETIAAILDKYAKEYNFTKEEVLAAVKAWAQPSQSDDTETKALKEFWDKNYTKAGQLALESAIEADKDLEQDKQKRIEHGRNSIRKFTLAGDSFSKDNKPELAKQAYQKLEARFADGSIVKEDFREAYAANELRIASISVQLFVQTIVGAYFEESTTNDAAIAAKARQLKKEAETYALQALTVLTFEKQPDEWAQAKSIYGLTHAAPSPVEAVKYRDESIAAFRDVQRVYTKKNAPKKWSQIQGFIISWLQPDESRPSASGDDAELANAFGEYAEIPMEYLDKDDVLGNATRLGQAIALYDEDVFYYAAAFALEQQWLARHPNDLDVQVDFAAKHFTLGRFAECEERINALLANPDVDSRTDLVFRHVSRKLFLRAIEIACLLAEGKVRQVRTKMDALIGEVTGQPSHFGLSCGLRSKFEDNRDCDYPSSFASTIHFIEENQKLSSHQDWLKQLFAALAGGDRDATLTVLRELRAKVKK